MERDDGLIVRRRVLIAGVDYSGVKENKSVALDHIHSHYKKALRRLPPELFPSLLEAGFCFGFLDPVSNILANTVSDELDKTKARKRSRDGNEKSSKTELSRRTIISKITATDTQDIRLIPRATDSGNAELRHSSVAARSLRGLVSILTSYFRHLTPWDALRYLSLSDADLLVAVHLIQEDRDAADTFTIHCNSTAETALRCAAIFALHPSVDTLVSRSLSLASRADEHAIARLHHRRKLTKTIPVFRAGLEISLKMVLLDRIDLLYLEAISRMPKHDLCSRHHRGLLKAGLCYGPFDPVTNIILNAIWYDTMFPPKKHFQVEMICAKSLARIECRSLCGLVAYLRVRFPTLSVYEALRRLLICNTRLDRVIRMAKTEGHVEDVPFSESVAYGTAAHAAHHPSPATHTEFTTMVMPQVGRTVWLTRGGKRVLSSSDVRTISETLSQISPPGKSLKTVQKLSKRATKIVSAHREEFQDRQGTIVKMAEAALLRYAKQGGQDYKLHFICDVNSTIPEYGVIYCRHSYNYPFCHMNIWARRRCSQNDDADQAPTLFFIQCSNNSDEDMQDTPFLCCPMFDPSKDAGRCYHCECEGTKVIHPSSESYLGRCADFHDMAGGDTARDAQGLVRHGQTNTLFDGTLEEEDSVYFDPAWDVDFSVFINDTARKRARYEKLRKMNDYSWIDELVRESSLDYNTQLI
ncbi:unnamed protein product [Alopecurus aequalis]